MKKVIIDGVCHAPVEPGKRELPEEITVQEMLASWNYYTHAEIVSYLGKENSDSNQQILITVRGSMGQHIDVLGGEC